MAASSEITDMLRRARDYPYDSPRSSFLYTNKGLNKFQPEHTIDRVPVLAFGSNKAPSQLKRKFGHIEDISIPVEMVKLHDFDVVFSAHITSYGAIPAMLQHCPGVIIEIAITWLDEIQLQLMHKSELYAGNYSFAQLENLVIERDRQFATTTAYAYLGERGHYSHTEQSDEAISVADIYARNRNWQSSSTAGLLSQIHKNHGFEQSEDKFILRLVRDVDYRRSLSAKLAIRETSFKYPYQKKTAPQF